MKFLRESFFFGFVGTLGFVVDVLVLYSLSGLVGLFYGRAISFCAAVFTTWFLNRKWTFDNRRSGHTAKREFAIYFSLMLVGGAVNYAAYVWLVLSYEFVQQHPSVGVAVGSLAGMFINLLASRFILFRLKAKVLAQ